MALAENRLQLHDVQGNEDPLAQGKLEGKGFNELTYGTWNPHQNCQQFATGDFAITYCNPDGHWNNSLIDDNRYTGTKKYPPVC